jgi:predicted metal-binding protein
MSKANPSKPKRQYFLSVKEAAFKRLSKSDQAVQGGKCYVLCDPSAPLKHGSPCVASFNPDDRICGIIATKGPQAAKYVCVELRTEIGGTDIIKFARSEVVSIEGFYVSRAYPYK